MAHLTRDDIKEQWEVGLLTTEEREAMFKKHGFLTTEQMLRRDWLATHAYRRITAQRRRASK